jgi:hypothetical protein
MSNQPVLTPEQMAAYVRELSEWRDTVDALRDRVMHLETLIFSPTTPEHVHDFYVATTGLERSLVRCRGCEKRWNVSNRIPIEAPNEAQLWDRVVAEGDLVELLNRVQP